MQFESIEAFLAMGGYATYVWLSWGFTLLVLIAVTVASFQKTKQIHKEVRESLTREKRINQAKEADLL